MKIVSWNANCKFREKYKEIEKLEADIYIIQECENPEVSKDKDYQEAVKNGFWVGGLNYKGLMIYSPNPEIVLEKIDWGTDSFRYFIPVKVNNHLTLVGCWACNPYIQEFYDFIQSSWEHLDSNVILMGDLNSNVIFDKDNLKSGKTHTNILGILKSIGLEDIYHYKTGEKQGQEKVPTFYIYRHLDKPFHIDHCFANPKNIERLSIHSRWQWLALSDHQPLEIIIDESKFDFLNQVN